MEAPPRQIAAAAASAPLKGEEGRPEKKRGIIPHLPTLIASRERKGGGRRREVEEEEEEPFGCFVFVVLHSPTLHQSGVGCLSRLPHPPSYAQKSHRHESCIS